MLSATPWWLLCLLSIALGAAATAGLMLIAGPKVGPVELAGTFVLGLAAGPSGTGVGVSS